MKKLSLVIGMLSLFIISSFGFAANSHDVTVTVNSFAKVTVTGSASVTIEEGDFVNGFASKDLQSTVQLKVKTNKNNGCKVYASASKDFSASFPVSMLQAKVDVANASFTALATTEVELANLSGKQNDTYSVYFKLVGLPETETAGTYTTTIFYTAAVNS